MKFSVQRAAFIRYLADVQRAISSKTTIEILKGLKLDLFEDGLTLTGSNADISIESIISIADEEANLEIKEPGSVVLPARFFNEIIKKLPADTLTIETDNQRFLTKITSGPAEFMINGIDAANFPHLPEVGVNTTLAIPSDILRQIINQTVIAISNQESRPMLTGVHILIDNGELLAVATDSHRLSQRRIKISGLESAHYNIIVPGKALNELARMLDESSKDVEIQIAENQILFILGHTSFYSRLLEGNYPDTERLIPKNSETTIEFNAPELLHAIERASLLSHEGRSNVVKLTLDVKEQRAVISGNSPEIGNVEEALNFSNLTGEDLEISFNPDYMKDALRSFGQTQTTLSFTMALRPFTLVPTESEGDFVQLITPMRTAN
ncbi:DNA polymerase III subunit beta [Ligilactobacillus sp. WILCCON 0076]|uniref:Beta sliding clamp n=1 Tax=Ligilactobacillus ubinensis TaxID=2876789 RepID=A0A9X2FMA6_9LACO|nr:DNA polymerase III subunit beta [Ligilactobacillus ubinensis]MCP0887078.1 DNA polymerase III subunit beta [Ligilactobacillus ubinensis]